MYYRLKAWDVRFILVALFVLFGLIYLASTARAESNSNNPQNTQELVNRVQDVNAGWDWIPRCGDGATWSTKDNRCKGGNGEDRSDNKQRSYDISNSSDFTQKVNSVDAGLDWEPRCAGGAHWSWKDNRCKGGNGDDDDHKKHKDHDDDDDD